LNSVPAERDGPAETIAGILAAVSIVASLLSLAYRPIRLAPFAIIVAFVATGIGGRNARLAAIAVGTSAVCFVLALTIAIWTGHPLY
jgi:hypothetical protein